MSGAATRYPATASAIGRKAGLACPDDVLTGAEIELPDDLPATARRVATRLLAGIGVLVPRADLPVENLDETAETLRAILGPQGWSLLAVGDARRRCDWPRR